MPRFSQSVKDKGSQKWIQKLVNEKPELLNPQTRRKLNSPEDEDIKWLSPLKDDEYAEYCGQDFFKFTWHEVEEVPLNLTCQFIFTCGKRRKTNEENLFRGRQKCSLIV